MDIIQGHQEEAQGAMTQSRCFEIEDKAPTKVPMITIAKWNFKKYVMIKCMRDKVLGD